MSDNRQHTGCSDPGGASGFSPASTYFQQTGGESVRLSSMGYASAQGHMLYPNNHLGQPSVVFSLQHGYMPYPANKLGLPSTGYSPQHGYMPCPENRFQPRQAPIPTTGTKGYDLGPGPDPTWLEYASTSSCGTVHCFCTILFQCED